MDASFQVLPKEEQQLYRDLTVLEKDVKVPAKVLSVLWDLEPEEVEDILQHFVNKSLLFRDSHQRPHLYYLHDLQLDFLAEQNRAQIEALHAKVELFSLMFSLDWVITKARVVGPADLINDYVEHGAMLDRELWDLESNKKMADLSGHLSWVHGVQFSPDGSMLLSCSDDHTVRLWETRRVHTTSAVRLKRDSAVLFDGDRITVVAAANCNRLQVREVPSSRPSAAMRGSALRHPNGGGRVDAPRFPQLQQQQQQQQQQHQH
ncbi:hypothetical protein CRUP_026256 [Coryphaenoides rupestris]|nr:hypothetical protein CRUP_026256 [Coryphaenoides rupestris]